MEVKRLTVPGLVFLWLVLHHCLFLRELDDHADKLSKAGIHRDAKVLEAYRMLNSYSLYMWPRLDRKKRLAMAQVVVLGPPSKRLK